MPDELLRPTIVPGPSPSARPWRLLPMGYIAVFGGVLPITWLSFVNSRRLGVSGGRRWLIVAVGVVGLGAEIAVAGWLQIGVGDGALLAQLTPVRVIAALCFLAQMRLQLPMERAFQLRGGEHAKRFGAGTLVLVGFLVVTEIVVMLVAGS
ncbi:hypothetical protein AB0E69_19760 [Kribbella sp. NPDC026611]|uniref:hypothetical protein n=1 Tax=Kribbella sp. NPDC026611 TaxID=3154911 RepID=UPI0033C71EF6